MHPTIKKSHQQRIQKENYKMNNQDEERIDRYLKGEMADNERKDFEQALLENDLLRKHTTEQALSIQAIRQHANREEERMLKTMQALSEKEFIVQLEKKVINPSPKRHRFTWTACALAATACISGMIYLHTQYDFYNSIKAELSVTQTQMQLSGQEVLRGGEVDDTACLKLQEASDCIQGEKYVKAIVLLEQIVAEGDINRHYQESCWQLSLCYLMNKEKPKAVRLLRQIVAEKQYQAEKASLLLRKLE